MNKQLTTIGVLEDMIESGWPQNTTILDAIQFLSTCVDITNLQPTKEYNKQQRIVILERDLMVAGDRRDSDACDRIEEDLDRLRNS